MRTRGEPMLTILVVDDCQLNRKTVIRALRSENCRLLEASDGQEGLRKIREEHPDVVITDLVMPHLDGLGLAEAVRADAELCHTPIIFYSGTYSLEDTKVLAQKCSVQYVLPKPSDPGVIRDTVHAVLGLDQSLVTNGRARVNDRPVSLFADEAEQYLVQLEQANQHISTLVEVKQRTTSKQAIEREIVSSVSETFAKLRATHAQLIFVAELLLLLIRERAPRELARLLTSARKVVPAEFAVVALLDNRTAQFLYFHVEGMEAECILGCRPALEEILSEWLLDPQPRRLGNLKGDPKVVGLPVTHPSLRSFLAVPVRVASCCYGFLYLGNHLHSDEFTHEEQKLIEILAAQAARALENAFVWEEVQRDVFLLHQRLKGREDRKQEVDSGQNAVDLLSTVLTILGTNPNESAYMDVLDIILEHFSSGSGFFGYVAEDGSLICPAVSRDLRGSDEGSKEHLVFAPSSWTQPWSRVLLKKTSWYENVKSPPDAHQPPTTGWLGVPLLLHGEAVGMIYVADAARDYDKTDQKILEQVASTVALVLRARTQGDREERERRQTAQRMTLQYAVARILADSLTVGEATLKILEAIAETYQWQLGCMWIMDRQREELRFADGWHAPEVQLEKFFAISRTLSVSKGIGIAGLVWESSQPVYVSNLTSKLDPEIAKHAQQATLGVALGFPLKAGDRMIAVMEFFAREMHSPDEPMLAMFASIGSQFSQFIERKHAEFQLGEAQKLKSVGELTAGMVHEIRSPLQYVGDNMTFLQDAFRELTPLLSRELQVLSTGEEGERISVNPDTELLEKSQLEYLQAEIPQALNQAVLGIFRMRGIVQSLREFSYPGGGEKQLVNINRLIESSVILTTGEWKYVARFEPQFDPDLPEIWCLPTEFSQVMVNLIVNAAHAISEKGVQGEGKIVISTKNLGNCIEIRVEDNGGGIPQEIAHRLFEPFFTTKKFGTGTGQGLFISRSIIVQKLGGTLTFDSTPGTGTTFIIKLPVSEGFADLTCS